MAYKFALNAGHWNGTTRGVPASLSPKNHPNEWVLNDRVCDAIQKLLAEYDGIEVLRIDDTTGKVFVEDADRYGKANKWGADFYLGVHHNGGINGGTGGGIVAYTYLKATEKEREWQKDLYNALVKETGLKGNRALPIAKADLFECRETKMDAVLLELGFMDSKTDIKYILADDWANKCAKAIVSVIVAKWKLKKKVVKEVFKKGEKSLGVYSSKVVLSIAKALGMIDTGASLQNNNEFNEDMLKSTKLMQKLTKVEQTGEIDQNTMNKAMAAVKEKIKTDKAELKTAKTNFATATKNLTDLNAKYKKEQTARKAAEDKITKLEKQLDTIIAKKGDVNADGVVDLKDVLTLRKMLVNK